MHWNIVTFETYGRVVLSVPMRNGRRFGLVMSPDWSEFFIGTFEIIKELT